MVGGRNVSNHSNRNHLVANSDDSLDQPFTLYQGCQEPKEEDIIVDADDIDGEGSIKVIYTLGHTIPNPIDATQCVTIVSFTQEAVDESDWSTQAGVASVPSTIHLTNPTIHTFISFPSPFQTVPIPNPQPIPALPVTVNPNLPPKRFPKPTPIRRGFFDVVWQVLGFFHR